MLSEKIQTALNDQLRAEFASSYVYLAMSAHLENADLPGMANWMRVQAREEATHAMKIYQYILDRDGVVNLQTIEQPQSSWETPLALFEAVLEHEESVSASIYALVELANKENDHATHTFLQWFVSEQVEEEANVREVLSQVRLVGGDGHGLFLIDRELAGRSPADAGEA